MGATEALLAGQTWSTFVDEANIPNTIDFESPMAFPSIRQAQLRWTQKLGAKASWSVAVEDNKSTITLPSGIARQGRIPDAGPGRAFPLRRPRAGTPRPRFFSAGALPADGQASRTT